MYQKRLLVVLIGFALSIIPLHAVTQETTDPAVLLQQLQLPEASDGALTQLSKLGAVNQEARDFLAQHLPSLIAKGPAAFAGSDAWDNCVRLAGVLKIAEAVPALIKWGKPEPIGTVTLAQEERLGNDPVGKALAQIGDPAVSAVSEFFTHERREDREFAIRILEQIGSPKAKQALEAQLQRESNPELRSSIERFMR